ncbi:MAG: carbohydrate esterase [Sandaracinus sp.]|nr:carbohydrate esterase [Myxococcales bacterium]MAT27838.1 carbohydrate esterase [Sandaracinus sp.]MBJ71274.1 carbohydrate esterase [Sandaracinus sp.]
MVVPAGKVMMRNPTPSLASLALAGVLLAGVLLAGCGFERRLEYVPVRAETMGGAQLSYSVYTPPGFREDERLPLVVFLHGGGDDPAVFDRHGLSARFDAAYREGRLPRAVLMFPQGDNGFWMNWHDGTRHYQDWVVDELLPEVVRRYHTQPCPQGCHVMGVSMGGHGALRFALDRPEAFRSVSALSGPIFDTEQMLDFTNNRLYSILIPTHRIFGPPDPARVRDEDLFLRWDDPEDVRLSVFLAWGTNDRGGIKRLNERFSEHLEESGIHHHAEEYVGDHAWVSWAPVIERALRYQVGREALEPSETTARIVHEG